MTTSSEVNVTLPSGDVRVFSKPITALECAKSIGSSLAGAMVAASVNGRVVDASTLLEGDVAFAVIKATDPEGLEVIRHSTAHLLAQAVKQMYPEAQVTIGPVIEDGFYYDFYYPQGFSEDDLKGIEAQMKSLVEAAMLVERKVMSRAEAIDFFTDLGETYKVEIIQDLPEDEVLTVYGQGDFMDLCRGPHVQHTGQLGAFCLTKVAGAYWRGDANNVMLQRIYGTAWPDRKQLKAYLHRIEEAKKRDHRLLGAKLNLFHMQEEAPGMVFWHSKGWRLYQTIVAYIRECYQAFGYKEIATPQMVDISLWERSGHRDKFSDEMFEVEFSNRQFAIKPMNCPCHVQVFNHHLRSYKELPLRLAEFGYCHRCEPSGTLHGLMRVRGFVQDDGHIFCTESHIESEVKAFLEQVQTVYKRFGFDEVKVCLSTRPEQRVGSDAIWDKSEKALGDALDASGLQWTINPGEGAFYGPKVELSLHDCLGRVWQCGTIQLDFSMPERLGASYIDEDGQKKVPVMLHRAMLGSLERFIAILLEEYAGVLPLWLAPVQAVVLNITDSSREYATEVQEKLAAAGFRVETDLRGEKINYKIREHSMARVPYLLICGDKEAVEGTVSIRKQDGERVGVLPLTEIMAQWQKALAENR